MTTAFFGVPAIKTDAGGGASRAGLRLVSASGDAGDGLTLSKEAPSVPCLVLNSALGDKNFVDESALVDLFQSLRTGEGIEFHHAIHRDEFGNAPAGLPYHLRVNVAAAPSGLEDLKLRVASVFASAFAGFHFASAGPQPSIKLRHVAQFALSGVVAAQKPPLQKFAPDWNESPTLSGHGCAGGHPGGICLELLYALGIGANGLSVDSGDAFNLAVTGVGLQQSR